MFFFRLFFLALFVLSVNAAEVRLENKIKAAYLYNFTKFIRWPELPEQSFNVCTVGKDEVTELLTALEGRKAQDRTIHLYNFQSVEEIDIPCQILYLAKDEPISAIPSLHGVLLVKSLKQALTVSSQPSFARQGGMIGFVLVDQRVRLQVNLAMLKRHGLEISAKLLEVAEVITGEGDE